MGRDGPRAGTAGVRPGSAGNRGEREEEEGIGEREEEEGWVTDRRTHMTVVNGVLTVLYPSLQPNKK